MSSSVNEYAYLRENGGDICALCFTIMSGISPSLWIVSIELVTVSLEDPPTIGTACYGIKNNITSF